MYGEYRDLWPGKSEIYGKYGNVWEIPSGKHANIYGKSPCLVGKFTISIGPFPKAMLVYQRVFGFGPRYLKSTGDFSGEVHVSMEILYGDAWKK